MGYFSAALAKVQHQKQRQNKQHRIQLRPIRGGTDLIGLRKEQCDQEKESHPLYPKPSQHQNGRNRCQREKLHRKGMGKNIEAGRIIDGSECSVPVKGLIADGMGKGQQIVGLSTVEILGETHPDQNRQYP